MTSDFRLYHSNALDLLAELLARELQNPVAGRPLLQPDIILIPQVAMRRWLQSTLAHRHGVAANLQFLTPGELVSRILDANLGASSDDLALDALQWRVYAALGDAGVLAQPALAQIADYLDGNDPARRWALAGELASSFNRYAAWRREWLLQWERGDAADDAQAVLWRTIASGKQHRARRIEDYLARFERGVCLPSAMPERLFAFATMNVSPDVLRVIATQARVGTLHFYLSSPVRDYWGDLAPRHAGDIEENPLLRDWGGAGKDFIALLGGYEVVHPSGEVDSHLDPAEVGGAFRHSLLRRMQSDLYNRRPLPQADLRSAVDKHDPSLQFHACHTRLRELQVLHDRLHALLDPTSEQGQCFDPPLQPREIAVLAPDIDQYTPYLQAVFAGEDAATRIPYAVADASPLQGEPLAAIFLHLLALPVSRFGLQEVLDLLASPPLASAAGLGEADFERLHAWLHAAGARWGLDAGHRERTGVPGDGGCTWQFALDRILLGYASGDAQDIGTVAPWPQLEGSALDALDRLLRLLGELARHERLFRTALTPAQWRERLLGLLDALLPEAPSGRVEQRALERLRKLVDDFAEQARRVDFDAPLAVDVVRAHFSKVLGEADTRAPLLTGGVSFARMVPMRLLPFRVICLLGMNDGEFPRSDPAAGLNRLTNEISAGKRRPGDRSNRDDDRFLFLQLFAAAQDVFYLSWLGMRPQDGSTREPSALVSELLTSAAHYHQAPRDAQAALLLTHPLQPFSTQAFGDAEDPRHFSYQQCWHSVASHGQVEKTALPAWLPRHTMLPAAPLVKPASAPALTDLKRFFMAPAEQFLRQRLLLRLPEHTQPGEDIEPLAIPSQPLDKHALQRAVFAWRLAGDADDVLLRRLRARALLPAGPLGQQVLEAIRSEIDPYVEAFSAWRGEAQPATLPLQVMLDGQQLHGQLHDTYPQGIARLRFGEPSGSSVLRNGLDWLFACAAGNVLPFVEFHADKQAGVGPHLRQPVAPEIARNALHTLLALHREGLQEPLAFAPYSSWELFRQRDNPGKGLRDAANKWRGGNKAFAEGDSEALQLAFRGRDLFTRMEGAQAFARISGLVFGAASMADPCTIELSPQDLPEADAWEEME